MSNRNPEISVVLPVHNGERYLEEAVESVLSQTFRDLELIIVENASTDRSLEIARNYEKRDSRVKVVHSDESGVSRALNLGTAMANGLWFARMDADDVWLPEKLEKQWQFIRTNPDVHVIGTYGWKISESGNRIGIFRAGPTTRDEFLRLREQDEIIHLVSPSAMFSRTALDTVGGHDDSYVGAGAEDVEYWNRIADTLTVMAIPEPLLLYRVHASSASTVSIVRQNIDAARAQENMRRRRSGQPELSSKEHEMIRDQRPFHEKLRERTSWQSQYYYRLGGGLLGDGKVLGAVWLALAFVLNPILVVRRLYQKRFGNALATK